MKLTAIILLAGALHLSARTCSQTITLRANDISLKQAFDVIEKQTGYYVVSNKDLLENSKKVSVDVKNIQLNDFLQLIFSNQPLIYMVEENNILVARKPTPDLGPSISSSLFLPPITVRGKVLDEKGEPVAASIIVKGTKNGTTTDGYGNFLLNNVNDKATLVISGINIETSEIKIDGRNEITVAAVTKITSEEEVTVKTNYYSTTKRLSTGNISKVTSKEIGNQPVVSPLLALQGRVPGLEVSMQGSATPGSAPKIRVRGNNSLRIGGKGASSDNDGNYPLYVIDGIPVISIPINAGRSPDILGSGYDPLNTINPENIESVEILKDADATAIYGSRGANGVILITTKIGRKNLERTDIDISIYKGIGKVARKLDLLNTEQYLSMRREAIANDGLQVSAFDYDLTLWDQTRYTDWQDVLTGGTAQITDLQASVSGGNQSTSFRLGGAFHKETLVFPGDFGFSRPTVHLSVSHASKNQKFKVLTNTNFGESRNKVFNGNQSVANRLTLAPNAPRLFNDDGSLNWEIHEIDGKKVSTWYNPLAYLLESVELSDNNLVSNAVLSYQLWPGLTIETSLGYQNLNSTTYTKNTPQDLLPEDRREVDEYKASTSQTNNTARSWIVEPKISYTKKVREHSFDITLGTTWQKRITGLYSIQSHYISELFTESQTGAALTRVSTDYTKEYKYASLYGRLAYNLAQKYLLSLTARRDGSSRFRPNDRYGNFGAIGAGWIFSGEKWINQRLPFLTFGKLRGSYGITGNDAVDDYRYYDLYQQAGGTYQGGIPGLVPSGLYNPNFSWETTKKLELALELSFFNNRLGVDVNWYCNRSSNQLIDLTLPEMTGFPSVISNFAAVVQNEGLEGLFRIGVIRSKKFRWDAFFNISIPENKLLQFDGIEDAPYYKTYFKVGEPTSIQWLYTYQGVNPQTGLYEFEDVNKDGSINDLDRRLMNPTDSRYYGGLTNTFQLENFELSIHFLYSNKPAFRYMPRYPGGFGTNQPAEVLDRWFAPGDETDIQRFGTAGIANGVSTAFVRLKQSSFNSEDGSFVQLQTLSLAYVLPSRIVDKVKIQSAKIFFQGQNLLTLTTYKGLDPQTGEGPPPPRMITAGLQLKF